MTSIILLVIAYFLIGTTLGTIYSYYKPSKKDNVVILTFVWLPLGIIVLTVIPFVVLSQEITKILKRRKK